MAFFVPSPRSVVELGRSAFGQVVETAAATATVPVRLLGLLSQAELVASRISLIAERAEAQIDRAAALIDRVGAVVDEADETLRQTRAVVAAAVLAVDRVAMITADAERIVEEAGTVAVRAALAVDEVAVVSTAASGVVRQASSATREAGDLLEGYAPTLREAAPLAARFVAELTPDEVTAAIRMIDELPRLREHLADDVMPLLGKLDQVGPDLHSLLEVTRDLHLAIAGIPGLRMLRRRGEQRLDDEETADADR